MNWKVDGKVLWIIASTFGRLTLGQTRCYMLSTHFRMFIRLQGCGIISSFQVQEQRFSEGAGLALVKKLRTDKTRDQTPLLDSRPRLLVILLCCSDTVAANLHMAVWVSEHKLALCCRSSPVGTYTHHWNQPWPYYQKWHIRCHSSLLRRSSRHGNPQGAFVQNSSTGTAGSSSDQQILLDMLNWYSWHGNTMAELLAKWYVMWRLLVGHLGGAPAPRRPRAAIFLWLFLLRKVAPFLGSGCFVFIQHCLPRGSGRPLVESQGPDASFSVVLVDAEVACGSIKGHRFTLGLKGNWVLGRGRLEAWSPRPGRQGESLLLWGGRGVFATPSPPPSLYSQEALPSF